MTPIFHLTLFSYWSSVLLLVQKLYENRKRGKYCTHKLLYIKIHRDREARKLWLSKKNYIRKVLEIFSMFDTKPVSTLLANHFRLSGSQCLKNEEELKIC